MNRDAIAETSTSGSQTRSRFLHPQFSQAVLATSTPRVTSSDEAMTAQTIALMRRYAVADSQSEIVQRAAIDATEGNSSARECAAGVWQWIKQRVRFQTDEETAAPFCSDPAQAEVLIRPVDLLTMPRPAGDCDDFSMLCASMLLAVGIDSDFTTVAAEPNDPHTYTHVYVTATVDGGQRLALDCSHGRFAGWEVKTRGKKKNWKVGKAKVITLKGYDPNSGEWTADPVATPSNNDVSSTTINLPWFGAGAPNASTIPTNSTSQSSSGSSAPAFDFNNIAQTLVKSTAGILTAQFGVPQVPTGTYIQTANGVMYRQPAGSASLNPATGVSFGTATGSSGLMLMGLAAVVIFAVIAMGAKR